MVRNRRLGDRGHLWIIQTPEEEKKRRRGYCWGGNAKRILGQKKGDLEKKVQGTAFNTSVHGFLDETRNGTSGGRGRGESRTHAGEYLIWYWKKRQSLRSYCWYFSAKRIWGEKTGTEEVKKGSVTKPSNQGTRNETPMGKGWGRFWHMLVKIWFETGGSEE